MLLLDERIGSKDLIRPLLLAGVPAELAHLDFADLAFVGRGLNDEPLTIGIELKRIRRGEHGHTDLIQSLQSDRFAGHQLVGMQAYDRAWLVTEGIWRASEAGTIELYEYGKWEPLMNGRHYIMMRDVESRLMTLLVRGGFHYQHCPRREDFVRFISVLYHWWTNKALDEHRSHQAIYIAPPDRAMMVEPSETLKMMSCLPAVGWDRAQKLEGKFGSIAKLVHASPKSIQTVEGIGKVIAEKITKSLWNDEDPRYDTL